jgi:hypothetical protein
MGNGSGVIGLKANSMGLGSSTLARVKSNNFVCEKIRVLKGLWENGKKNEDLEWCEFCADTKKISDPAKEPSKD